jgi:uncharacterized protein YdgA (DUF945 family)
MKTLIRLALILVLPGVIAYPASAWFLGRQLEVAVMQPSVHLQSLPFVRVVAHEYRRGLFSSDETVTLELFGDMTRFTDQAQKQRVASTADEPASGQPFKPVQISLRSHIKHGPWPDGSTPAAAIVDSELDIDERFAPDLAKVLGDRKLLTAHSVYRLWGGGESTVTSPSFVFALPGIGQDAAGRIAWMGIKATIRFSKDLGSYRIAGEAPGLDVAVRGGHITVAGLRFDTESKRVFEDEPLFYSGEQKFSVALVSIDGPAVGDGAIELKQLTYDVSIPVNGDFIDIFAKIGVQDVLVGENNFGPSVSKARKAKCWSPGERSSRMSFRKISGSRPI